MQKEIVGPIHTCHFHEPAPKSVPDEGIASDCCTDSLVGIARCLDYWMNKGVPVIHIDIPLYLFTVIKKSLGDPVKFHRI